MASSKHHDGTSRRLQLQQGERGQYLILPKSTRTALGKEGAKAAKTQPVRLLALHQKRIALSFFSDRGQGPVARNHHRLIRKRQHSIVKRSDDLIEGATG